MEQARLLIAIVLSFLIFFLWNIFFVEKKPSEDVPEKSVVTETEPRETTSEKKVVEEPKETYVAGEQVAVRKEGARTITVNTPFYTVKIDEKGAVLRSYVLKDYREHAEPDSPFKELVDSESEGELMFTLVQQGIPGLAEGVFTASEPLDRIEVAHETEELVFSWMSNEGVLVEKRYGFDPNTYLIDLKVTIKNGSDRQITDSAVLEITDYTESDKRGYAFEGPSAMLNDGLEQIKIKKIKEKQENPGKFKWIAIVDRYFIKSIIPSEETEGMMKLSLVDETLIKSRLILPENRIDTGTQRHYDYKIFFGPKSMKVLGEMGYELNRAVHFGMFDVIAKPCLWFMNAIYDMIPNYGVAIIILTLLTKILLWPLGSKSYKSMNEMKRIQPLMAEIREKHKNDKKQMNQEVMALYRTYKINPLGGCLPMVLQIPVFFALYRMLYQAIELRHAPFLWWINDLAAPDRLLRFDFSIPFMQPPYGIPVLTLVMGATMLLQQKMSPPPGDPTQAKMMMMMPIVFTFIFINFSSGLVLYWLINNVLSIAQQYYIQKKNA
jgi:YidC/Oxa1 family membrane protein insertase